jgi:hypothetical protein
MWGLREQKFLKTAASAYFHDFENTEEAHVLTVISVHLSVWSPSHLIIQSILMRLPALCNTAYAPPPNYWACGQEMLLQCPYRVENKGPLLPCVLRCCFI